MKSHPTWSAKGDISYSYNVQYGLQGSVYVHLCAHPHSANSTFVYVKWQDIESESSIPP